MATILRGKRKGEQARIHQWANDWFSVDHADGTPGIVNPTSLQLDAVESARWRDEPGGMERWFEITDAGRFRRKAVR